MEVNEGFDQAGRQAWSQTVVSEDRDIAIARGYIPGASVIEAYGERTTTGAETNAPVRAAAGFALPAAAGVQMSVVSASANDAAAGTGVRKVEIHYLDDLLAQKSEIVILNGITPVLTVATNIRFIQTVYAIDAGNSPAAAAGAITVSNGGTTYATISAGETHCASSFRMVPAGYVLRIAEIVAGSISGTAAAQSKIRLVTNYHDGSIFTAPIIWLPFRSVSVQDGSLFVDLHPQTLYPAGAVIGMLHTTDKAATIAAAWAGYLEPA